MGPNRTVTFPFEDFGSYTFEQMPKGDLLRFGVNPYNGKVVLSFQDFPYRVDVAQKVIDQISREMRQIRRTNGVGCGLHEFADLCDGLIHKRELYVYTSPVPVGFGGEKLGGDGDKAAIA